MDPLFEQLQARAGLCGVQLDFDQLVDINSYCTLLSAYNQKVNLVSRCDLDFLLFEHILDSLTLIPLIENLHHKHKNTNLVDIGAGAGFPGLVLAIVLSYLRVTLIEATAKKCKFLNEVVVALNLGSRVEIINARAEDLGHDKKYRGQFQFATARALGPIEMIAELAMPLLQEGGYLLAQKSHAQIESELASGTIFFSAIGANLEQVVILSKEALGKEHVVMAIKKVKPTPKQFPRAFSKIAGRKITGRKL